MDYELFYGTLSEREKKLKEALLAATKANKALEKALEFGDLKNLVSSIEDASEASARLSEAASNALADAKGFDGKAYFASGDYATQLLAECKRLGIDVRGEYPVYEMFPYRVKLDEENQEVSIDRKKYPCLRPAKLASIIKEGQDKLNKAPFKAEAFLNELSDAYDLALLKLGKTEGTDIYLNVLYKFLVPMARSRKEYDMQAYAFDLARLYAQGIDLLTKGGRGFQFGPSRDLSKAIRVLDDEGKEQYLATIGFFKR